MTQVVLITGGTSGIGRSLADAFISQGAAVAVCGRSEAALERFSHKYPDALAIRADVTVGEARIAMLDAVADRFGRLDVLINNAGTLVERNFAAAGDATRDLDREVALNLTAPIQLTGEVLQRWPALTAIVFVTSGYALVSPTRAPTYGAVKAGLHGFAEGLRRAACAQRRPGPRGASAPGRYTGDREGQREEDLARRGGGGHSRGAGAASTHGAAGPDEAPPVDAADRAELHQALGR